MSKYGLEVGTPELRSAGAITFGPEGILFVADNASAAVFAIDVADEQQLSPQSVEIEQLDTQLAALLGVGRDDVTVRGMAVHPQSQAVYLSVTRGRGNSALPVIVRIADGQLSEV